MSVGLPSVCLSVPAVQEQKVCTASVDRQTHHNSLILPKLMSREEERVREVRGEHAAALTYAASRCKTSAPSHPSGTGVAVTELLLFH